MRTLWIVPIVLVGGCDKEEEHHEAGPICSQISGICHDADEAGVEGAAECHETAHAGDEAACEEVLDDCLATCGNDDTGT